MEDPDRVASPQQLERGLVGEVNRVDVDALASSLRDEEQAVGDHIEVAEPEEVHLQQA